MKVSQDSIHERLPLFTCYKIPWETKKKMLINIFPPVIHFTLAASLGDELPSLLAGKAPASPSNSTIGTGNFAAPPQAMMIGGGFQQEDVDKLKALAEDAPGAVKIPWLWMDNSKGEAPTGTPSEEETKAIGLKVAARMKAALDKLRAEGQLGDRNPGVHMVYM